MLKAQQRRRVLRPALLDVLADAAHLVSQHFQPPQHRMQERALALEHVRHVGAQRLGTHTRISAKNSRICKTPTLVIDSLSLRTSPDGEARKPDKRTDRAMRCRQ